MNLVLILLYKYNCADITNINIFNYKYWIIYFALSDFFYTCFRCLPLLECSGSNLNFLWNLRRKIQGHRALRHFSRFDFWNLVSAIYVLDPIRTCVPRRKLRWNCSGFVPRAFCFASGQDSNRKLLFWFQCLEHPARVLFLMKVCLLRCCGFCLRCCCQGLS